MSEIKFDEATMNQIVTKAIMDSLDQKQRETIIEEAVKALTDNRASDVYGHRSQGTPIQAAFRTAVQGAATTVANTLVTENVELQARIKTLMGEAITALATEEHTLGSEIGSAIGKAVSEWLYEQRSR